MKSLYTRDGDDGYTSLLGEGRIPKYHPRPDTLGVIDEANAALGLARALSHAPQTAPLVLTVQRDLYAIMAEVAATPEFAGKFRTIKPENVEWLEQKTDELSKVVNIPSEFIIPGESASGAAISLARTVVRRAERHIASMLHSGEIQNTQLLRYMNRLSSLCFILELLEYQSDGNTTFTLTRNT
jgi:cob(I)alamin adenosyltransferase